MAGGGGGSEDVGVEGAGGWRSLTIFLTAIELLCKHENSSCVLNVQFGINRGFVRLGERRQVKTFKSWPRYPNFGMKESSLSLFLLKLMFSVFGRAKTTVGASLQ